MPLRALRRRCLAFAAALLAAGLCATTVLDVAGAQTPKTQKSAVKTPPVKATNTDTDAASAKGTQAIVVLVNDEPITAWEIEQRAAFMAANTGPSPGEMKAKAEARWAQIVKDPRTNERFQALLREKQVSSREQAQALQGEFVKKLQTDMVEQLKREARGGAASQFRKKAQEELIDERLKVQEGKKLGIELTDEELKRFVQAIAERNKMTLEQFTQHVRGSGFDISTLRDRVRAEQIWRELLRRRFGAQISVNQKDIDRAVSSEAGEDALELQVQKITLTVAGRADQIALVRRFSEAQALHSKFDGCKNLPGLVKNASDARIEDLKFVRPSDLPEPTRSLLLIAKDGDMLPPATLANAIELYAVCGRRAVKGNDRQREKVAQELQMRELDNVAKRRLFDLRQEALIEYR